MMLFGENCRVWKGGNLSSLAQHNDSEKKQRKSEEGVGGTHQGVGEEKYGGNQLSVLS